MKKHYIIGFILLICVVLLPFAEKKAFQYHELAENRKEKSDSDYLVATTNLTSVIKTTSAYKRTRVELDALGIKSNLSPEDEKLIMHWATR